MNLGFLELPPDERRLYFEQAALQKNISPLILEKDFWVCWLLELLFNSPLSESLVFKGGTSLSKVFQVIERFSEDIDLSVSPSFLDLPPPGTTRNQAHKWMKLAEAACAAVVRDRLCSSTNGLIIHCPRILSFQQKKVPSARRRGTSHFAVLKYVAIS